MTRHRDRCSVCAAALNVQTITYTETVGENVFLVEHVPAQVRPQCGETYLSPDTADTLQEIGKQQAYKPTRTVEVPVFDFGPALSRS